MGGQRTLTQQPLPGKLRAPDDPLVLRATARLMLATRRAVTAYGRDGDPWAFIRDCVWTLDEASSQVRKFPNKAYAEHLVRLAQEQPILAIAKSRRMVVTWLYVAYWYWYARFHPGSKIGLMARKKGEHDAEGSAELVKRAWFIHQRLPPVFPPVEAEYRLCHLTLRDPTTGLTSEMIGLAEGADQARQHTFTGLLCDEVVYWEQAYETWIALRPTVEGGGRIIAVSSAGPGFYRDLCNDVLR